MADSDLARRLAEHPRWRWLPGMTVAAIGDDTDGEPYVVQYDDAWSPSERLPDLSAPGTVGGLLHLLAEDEIPITLIIHRDVAIAARRGRWSGRGATSGEALAMALLDAWGAP